MKLVVVLFLSFFSGSSFAGDVIDEITILLRDGNAKDLSKHFSGTVSLTMITDENVYSKVQAEIVLRDFFHNNNPTGIKTVHRLDGNPNYCHVVLSLSTNNGLFRVSVSLRGASGAFQITEIRIEPASRYTTKE